MTQHSQDLLINLAIIFVFVTTVTSVVSVVSIIWSFFRGRPRVRYGTAINPLPAGFSDRAETPSVNFYEGLPSLSQDIRDSYTRIQKQKKEQITSVTMRAFLISMKSRLMSCMPS